jgi:hypothetical protein
LRPQESDAAEEYPFRNSTRRDSRKSQYRWGFARKSGGIRAAIIGNTQPSPQSIPRGPFQFQRCALTGDPRHSETASFPLCDQILPKPPS